VSEQLLHIPGIEEFLPDWTPRRFVVLDMSDRWAAAIRAQVNDRLRKCATGISVPCPVFEGCQSTREALLLCEAKNTVGAVLFISGIERECLNILARVACWSERPALLAVCSSQHEGLLPMLMESGVDSAMFDVENDVPVSDWCVRVLKR